MNNKTATAIIGGLAAGTVGVGIVSLAAWSIIPMTVWTLSMTVMGSQTINILRIKTGQLQPTQVIRGEQANVVPMRKEA